jgi:nanoRNase/pAp phosphatase (c-di-AMP/oligoRNAs hydrolase)
MPQRPPAATASRLPEPIEPEVDMNRSERTDVRKHDIPTIAQKNRVIDNIARAFIERENFLVLGHENPDEDCISAMVSVSLLLSKLSKKPIICTSPELPEHYEYLLDICKYNSIDINSACGDSLARVDTVIICDTPKPAMLQATEEVHEILASPNVVRIEFDHHLQADARYNGDEGYSLVAEASSSCELVGLLACKMSQRPDITEEFEVGEVFSRNMVLALLTGIVGDTQMGKFIKSRREQRFYDMFSRMFNELLAKKTTKNTNFFNMEQIYGELRRLSDDEERFHAYLSARRRVDGPVGYAVLDETASEEAHRNFDADTVISVARGIADELAEESGYLSMVGYYDSPQSSDLIQFRVRRSLAYRSLDLREVLPELAVDNGGGHEGAIGFRIEKSRVDDFPAFVRRAVDVLKAAVERDRGATDGG